MLAAFGGDGAAALAQFLIFAAWSPQFVFFVAALYDQELLERLRERQGEMVDGSGYLVK